GHRDAARALSRYAAASERASPNRVQHVTVAISASPGARAAHGAITIASRPSAIMLPQLGFGGWMPRPRNESPLSSKMALPTPSVMATIAGPSALGSTWRQR